jgi:hypothetical protein
MADVNFKTAAETSIHIATHSVGDPLFCEEKF